MAASLHMVWQAVAKGEAMRTGLVEEPASYGICLPWGIWGCPKDLEGLGGEAKAILRAGLRLGGCPTPK